MNRVGDGWRPWRMIPRVAGGLMSVPVVAGFIALGAAVVVVRSLRDLVRDVWGGGPARKPTPQTRGQTEHAA